MTEWLSNWFSKNNQKDEDGIRVYVSSHSGRRSIDIDDLFNSKAFQDHNQKIIEHFENDPQVKFFKADGP